MIDRNAPEAVERDALAAETEPTLEEPTGAPEAPVAPTTPQSGDDEANLERDLEELAGKAQKADEYLELAKRTKADFENYRKRAARDAALAQERGVARLVRELLPAIDNLDRALEAVESTGDRPESEDGEGTLVSGIKLVHDEVIAALARVGIERYSPQGERFDPERHEAVAQLPVQDADPGSIVEVYQCGYRLGDSVIRPARVVVAG
jgi:molecular chaperone GrpE